MGKPCTLEIKNNSENVLRVEWESGAFPEGIGGAVSVIKPYEKNYLESRIIHHNDNSDVYYRVFKIKMYEYNFEYPIKYEHTPDGKLEPIVYKEKPITYIGELEPSFLFNGRSDTCYEIKVEISISGGEYTYLLTNPYGRDGVYSKGNLGRTSPDGLYTIYVPYPEI